MGAGIYKRTKFDDMVYIVSNLFCYFCSVKSEKVKLQDGVVSLWLWVSDLEPSLQLSRQDLGLEGLNISILYLIHSLHCATAATLLVPYDRTDY